MVHIEPTSNTQRERKLDGNGDEIIAEGVCHRGGVIWGVFSIYTTILAGVVVLLIGLCCAVKAAYSWKLHLTSTGIWYTDVIRACSCLHKQHFIPLSDISDIQVQGKSIQLNFNADVVRKTTYPAKLAHVQNAEEFAAAVKRQMAANHM